MLELDCALTASEQERLKSMDFDQMILEEIAEAKAMLARLELPIPPLMSRRWQRASRRSVINRAGSLRLAQRPGSAPWTNFSPFVVSRTLLINIARSILYHMDN